LPTPGSPVTSMFFFFNDMLFNSVQAPREIHVSTTLLSFRMHMRNLSFGFVFGRLTTRSLAGVYTEFSEVLEMTKKSCGKTDLGIATTES
jgi:hypothetical protein